MTEEIRLGSGGEGNDELEVRKAPGAGAEPDAGLNQVLVEFRSSVDAWSEAVYSRARMAEIPVRQRSWRLAAGWALGCALVAGGIAGGVVEHRGQHEAARAAAAVEQQVQQQPMDMELKQAQKQDQVQDRIQNQMDQTQKNQTQEPGLMAKVDSDTAQEVPDAMQPLAQLMEDAGNQ